MKIDKFLSRRGREAYFPKDGIIAQTAEARGKGINATIGIALGDDSAPMRLKSIAEKVSLDPKEVFTYAPSFGKPELRLVWKEEIKKKNPGIKGELSLPVVTNGITHGLSVVGHLFVDEGDRIILPDRFWGNYKLVFEKAYGAVLDTFNTFKDGSFDIGAMKEKLAGDGKKILLLNFPNNPTGYTPTEEEVQAIVGIVKQSGDVLVICDDAYFGLVYEDGIYKESVFSELAGLENVLAVKLDGATKEECAWGLRVGFMTFGGLSPEENQILEEKTAGIIRGGISNVSHLSQSLVLHGLKTGDDTNQHAILQRRFMKVKETLKEDRYRKYFSPYPFNSGYFMCLKLKGADAEGVRKKLLERYDTGVVAMGGVLRIAFSSVKEDDIPDLFENIFNACEEVSR
ncbi:aminotransferase class I/II-fold pyridoxal phosphate-dependent enzyme [Nanoarchaeota archaeon]